MNTSYESLKSFLVLRLLGKSQPMLSCQQTRKHQPVSAKQAHEKE